MAYLWEANPAVAPNIFREISQRTTQALHWNILNF